MHGMQRDRAERRVRCSSRAGAYRGCPRRPLACGSERRCHSRKRSRHSLRTSDVRRAGDARAPAHGGVERLEPSASPGSSQVRFGGVKARVPPAREVQRVTRRRRRAHARRAPGTPADTDGWAGRPATRRGSGRGRRSGRRSAAASAGRRATRSRVPTSVISSRPSARTPRGITSGERRNSSPTRLARAQVPERPPAVVGDAASSWPSGETAIWTIRGAGDLRRRSALLAALRVEHEHGVPSSVPTASVRESGESANVVGASARACGWNRCAPDRASHATTVDPPRQHPDANSVRLSPLN